jgi:uncharacterized cupredoxin-like copper-binding protein
MPTTIRSTRVRAFAALCAFSLLAVACGDDDDTEASTDTTVAEGEAAGADVEEYCAAVAEMEEAEGFDAAQFERIKAAAPEEISEEIDYVADAFIEAEGDFGAAFADPKVEEMLGPIEAFEEENCDAGEEDERAVAPELQEYCDFVAELDSQDGPPSEEQLLELKEIRPDAVGEDTDMVVDAFVAAEGDIGAVFSDPAVEEAFGRMEAHDAENCGFETEEGEEEEAATEPLEGAEIIEVAAVDFAFEGIPDTVPAGDVSFHMTNEGDAAHEMFMARLGEGVELDDLLAMEEEPSPEQAEEIGGTFAPPGESAYLNAEGLEPGTYAVVCFIPGPEGKAHHELGMKQTFQVG